MGITNEMIQCMGEGEFETTKPTLMDQLKRKSDKLTKELGDVTEAREVLKKNPEIERLLNLLIRVGLRY